MNNSRKSKTKTVNTNDGPLILSQKRILLRSTQNCWAGKLPSVILQKTIVSGGEFYAELWINEVSHYFFPKENIYWNGDGRDSEKISWSEVGFLVDMTVHLSGAALQFVCYTARIDLGMKYLYVKDIAVQNISWEIMPVSIMKSLGEL